MRLKKEELLEAERDEVVRLMKSGDNVRYLLKCLHFVKEDDINGMLAMTTLLDDEHKRAQKIHERLDEIRKLVDNYNNAN